MSDERDWDTGTTGTGDEFDEYDKYSDEDIKTEKAGELGGAGVYSLMKVDLWRTEMHTAIIGIKKQAVYQSKSRQFSPTTDVVGDVSFYKGYTDDPTLEKEYREVVTVENKYWDIKEEKSFIKGIVDKQFSDYNKDEYSKLMRKLIIKTFVGITDKEKTVAGNWTGTIEESQIFSLALTFGEKDPLPFFFIDLPGYKYRIPLFRSHAVTGERFVFCLFNDNQEVLPFYIEGKRLTPGSDYTVFNAKTMEKVAFLDDRAMDIGGKVDIRLYEEYDTLNRNSVFRRILILFSAASKFLHEIYRDYKTLYEGLIENKEYIKEKTKKGADQQKVEEKFKEAKKKMKYIQSFMVWSKELTMHYNPRRVRT